VMSTLLEPVNIGALELKNRVVMAPLTRMRAVNDRTPGEIVKTYYTQRASAGLIISEATQISAQAKGYGPVFPHMMWGFFLPFFHGALTFTAFMRQTNFIKLQRTVSYTSINTALCRCCL
ncbi:hypothetical protein QCE80_15470, partial [Staphylococcus aureus]|nr:hypothetical protein [Staphylococcus aureus]